MQSSAPPPPNQKSPPCYGKGGGGLHQCNPSPRTCHALVEGGGGTYPPVESDIYTNIYSVYTVNMWWMDLTYCIP